MPFPLHLSRRHRRPLLFPPGLLALAWLLWLGCAALPQMRGMRPEYIMSLYVPTVCGQLNNIPNAVCVPPAQEVDKICPWQTIDFIGNAADESNFQLLQQRLRAMQKHQPSTIGIAVRFHAEAHYASLVQTLSYVGQVRLTKYFLHVHSPIVTLYILPTIHSAEL